MPEKIKSIRLLIIGILGLELLAVLLPVALSFRAKPELKAKQMLVKRFLLTDYCFSTESRHTRHLSSPELIAPFQDFPGYLEHFPSSSFFQIPKDQISE